LERLCCWESCRYSSAGRTSLIRINSTATETITGFCSRGHGARAAGVDALQYFAAHDLDYANLLDLKKLVVTGFSRWGKEALLAGFLDDRFQVTAPGGSGRHRGAWRPEVVFEYFKIKRRPGDGAQAGLFP